MIRFDWATTSHIRYLGILALAFLIWYLDPGNLVHALACANFYWLFAALVLNLPLIALKTCRWRVLLGEAGISIPFVGASRTYTAGIFTGCISPGRLGKFIKAVCVSQNSGEPTGKAFPSVLIDRLHDLYFLLFLGLPGIFHYSLLGNQARGVTLTLLAGVLFAILINTPRLGNWLRQSTPVGRIKLSRRETLLEIYRRVSSLTSINTVRSFGLTAFSYLVFFFQYQLGARGTAVKIPFLDLLLVMSITNLLAFLPVSISGIGIRDLGLFALPGQFGIVQGHVLAF